MNRDRLGVQAARSHLLSVIYLFFVALVITYDQISRNQEMDFS